MSSRPHSLPGAGSVLEIATQGIGEVRRRLSLNGLSAFIRKKTWILAFLPTILSAIYLFLMASDQYVSEAKFVVRSAQSQSSPAGLSFLVQLGLQRSADDSFVAQEYMTSRDAVRELQELLPLREMYKGDALDFIAGYPSFFYGPRKERFYKYFQTMVSVIHTDKTGISTLRVRAFSAKNAHEVASILLQLSEGLVNRLNARRLRNAIGRGEAEVIEAQNRVIAAQTALTDFRNRELLIDPMNNAVALADLIAKMSSELATSEAQITEMKMSSAGGPQLPAVERRAAALSEQIASERARVTRNSDGLAARVATYEQLTLEREFANKLLLANEAELVRAKKEAMQQLLYVEVLVEPNLPDYSTEPKRFISVVAILVANVLMIMVIWLVYTGVREHSVRG